MSHRRSRPRNRRRAGLAAAITSAGLLAAACGAASSPASAPQLLRQAKINLDAAPALHFTLRSSGPPGHGTTLRSGEGDIARPDRLRGSFEVVVKGFEARVQVVAVGNVVEAKLPFANSFTRVDPSTFGIGNPTQLLDPTHGLSSLLTYATGARVTGRERLDGELLEEVSASVPGRSIPLLPDHNPSQAVRLLAAIDPADHQLRQITLTGPFTAANSETTFVVTLTDYGERVSIILPPT